MKDLFIPILILLGIITIALTGGFKNTQNNNSFFGTSTTISQTNTTPSPSEKQLSQSEIQYELQKTQNQANDIQKQIDLLEEAKVSSEYKGKITFMWGGWGGTDPNQEYIEIDASYSNTEPITISGWSIISTSTGQTILIPQSTNLYTSNTPNYNEPVRLAPGERAYIITGRSPIGYGLHANICSGYLSQFNTFIPSLYTSCPLPRNEQSIITIPRTQSNNNCFDLIDSLPACRVYTQTINNTYSSQCQDFIQTKINYQACVDIHKNDENFWSPKVWYVYLNREEVLWQPRRETLILRDSIGKQVMKISR